MSTAPAITSEKTAGGVRVALAGGWTVDAGSQLEKRADALLTLADGAREATIDLSQIDHMDTAGAWVIDRSRQLLAARGVEAQVVGARPEHAILLRAAHYRPTEAPPAREAPTLTSLVSDVGESVYTAGADLVGGVGFLGRMVSVGATVAVRPPRWRWTSTTFHLEQFSLRSAPIILLINFLVGAIVAQQGIFQLARFNATPFTVDLIGILVLRELGVLADLDHDRRPFGLRDHRGNRRHEDARGSRRADGDGARSDGSVDPAADPGADRRAAAAHLSGRYGGAVRRPVRRLGLRRHQPGGVPRAPAGRHRPQHVRGRSDQGAVHGAGDRLDRLGRRLRGARLGRVAGAKGDGIGRQIDLHGHRLDGLFAMFFAAVRF